MPRIHHYNIKIEWTGNTGTGTSSYSAYSRNHSVEVLNKISIPCSSDPAFRGDPTRYNPEELMVSSLSSCHMLWYLHFCAVNKIIVLDYKDWANGVMQENADGSGQFTEVTLNPVVIVADSSMQQKALQLHEDANKFCFIARSVNFQITHKPTILVENNN